jgi:hypothetical protein
MNKEITKMKQTSATPNNNSPNNSYTEDLKTLIQKEFAANRAHQYGETKAVIEHYEQLIKNIHTQYAQEKQQKSYKSMFGF